MVAIESEIARTRRFARTSSGMATTETAASTIPTMLSSGDTFEAVVADREVFEEPPAADLRAALVQVLTDAPRSPACRR
jgi:hypothetical protein